MISVLITGGSGFLGNALLEHLLTRPGVQRICIYSRGEFKQAQMRQQFTDKRIRWMIGDVRDKDRLRWATRGCTHVIHAAALKRIEVGRDNPTEMVETNVIGTMNVIDAAAISGVHAMTLVSSDKAWQPISPYGQSKALAEALVLAAHTERAGPTYSVVRYGNVWGSTGSVVPMWMGMHAEPVPITDPECTRFYMSVQHAVQFVLSALEGHNGGLHIPSDLPAYRLGDLAEAMGVQTHTIGLGPHEKLHEGMRDDLLSNEARRMTVAELRGVLMEGRQ